MADVAAGDRACEAADLDSLRRLAHNLRSALEMLGDTRLAAHADRVEIHAAAGEIEHARASWRPLRNALRDWQAQWPNP